MQIPSIPDYNGILFSGCTLALSNVMEDGRIYGPVFEYKTESITVLAVFDFIVKKDWGIMFNWAIPHTHRHLLIDGAIDYFSFTSLN